MLIFTVSQEPSLQYKVSLYGGKKTHINIILKRRTKLNEHFEERPLAGFRFGHLVPAFKRPLPPLEKITFTDARSAHLLRMFPPSARVDLDVVNHFPVFDVLKQKNLFGCPCLTDIFPTPLTCRECRDDSVLLLREWGALDHVGDDFSRPLANDWLRLRAEP